MFRLFKCSAGKHSPDRNRVHKTQDGYFGTCEVCGASLVRQSRLTWVRDPQRRARALSRSRRSETAGD